MTTPAEAYRANKGLIIKFADRVERVLAANKMPAAALVGWSLVYLAYGMFLALGISPRDAISAVLDELDREEAATRGSSN